MFNVCTVPVADVMYYMQLCIQIFLFTCMKSQYAKILKTHFSKNKLKTHEYFQNINIDV